MRLIFKDTEYSYQLLRLLGAACGGGSDIGECLTTAYRIPDGDDEAWYREWFATAERVRRRAEDFLEGGNTRSAGEAWARASNYYRAAEFFIHRTPSDPRILDAWQRSRDAFLNGSEHFDAQIFATEMAFEDYSLPGYLCLPDNAPVKRPLIIMTTGFDGTAEELYFSHAFAALRRGYNCLLFEGPGQGEVLRATRRYFRPDWEKVVSAVVDFALLHSQVDGERIALLGVSMGGYFAPRACAFEHRIAACIADTGIYDLHDALMHHLPPGSESYLDDPVAARELNEAIALRMKGDPGLRWAVYDALWKFNARSPAEWLRMSRAYTLKGCVEQVRCPTLVLDSELERQFPGEARRLFAALRCPKKYVLFTSAEGAGEHCQAGATMLSTEVMFNWLDAALKVERGTAAVEKSGIY